MIRAGVSVVLLACLPAFALEGFPSFVRLPDDVSTATVRITNFDEVALPLGGPTDTYKEGKVTEAFLKFQPEGNRPAEATWKAWAPSLAKDGWRVTWEEGNRHVLKRKTSDGERLLAVYVGDYDEPKLILVEPVVKPPKLDFPAPAAQVEKVSDTQDYPFLPAYPGAKLSETFHSDNPLLVQLPGSEFAEVVAQGAVLKSYQPPPGLEVDRENLLKALDEAPQDAELLLLAATTFFSANDLKRASEFVVQGQVLAPWSPEFAALNTQISVATKDCAEAELQISQLVSLMPDRPRESDEKLLKELRELVDQSGTNVRRATVAARRGLSWWHREASEDPIRHALPEHRVVRDRQLALNRGE